MREPPGGLSDESLRAALGARYGLAVTELTFLPLGHDPAAWVYRAEAAGDPYFLKVRRHITNPASLLAPHYLHDRGIGQVVAPLPTNSQTLWADTDGYALIVYPFVEAVTGMERGMTPQQWIDYGAILRRVHATTVAPDLAQRMQRESFAPAGAGVVRELAAHIGEQTFAVSEAQALAAFWDGRRDGIRTLLERAEDLGARLARQAPPFVFCHADIHTGNVLLDADQRVWIVDWDETLLAPKERDLMFVVGGISSELVGPREEELFFQGYGATTPNPLALAYYRYAWAVGDIAAYGAQVFCEPGVGAVTRRAAAEQFTRLFRPGEIVDLALRSEIPAACATRSKR